MWSCEAVVGNCVNLLFLTIRFCLFWQNNTNPNSSNMKDVKEPKCEASPLMGLTEVLILEILFRLPLKSLGILKCVCNKLNTLISNPDFALSHLQSSDSTPPPLTIAMLQHNTISSLNFGSHTDIMEGVNLTPWSRQFYNDDKFYSCFLFIVGSCNGLLCVYITEGKSGEDLMYLWNPLTKKNQGNLIACWWEFDSCSCRFLLVRVCSILKWLQDPLGIYSFYTFSFLWKARASVLIKEWPMEGNTC